MYFGRVIGTIVCERKYEGLEGKRFLLVQPLDHREQAIGPAEVAVDTVSARPQDLVFLVGSREAALALEPSFVPVDSAIVGIIDSVET
jgi:ethanolamine utilization protein EutN